MTASAHKHFTSPPAPPQDLPQEQPLPAALAHSLVTLCYQMLLGRDPDGPGRQHHGRMLRSYADIPDFICALALSDESAQKQLSGLQLARFAATASTGPAPPDPLLDQALVRALHTCLAPDRDLGLPLAATPGKPDPASGQVQLYLGETQPHVLTLLVCGGAGRTARLRHDSGTLWAEVPLLSQIDLHEIALPPPEDHLTPLRLDISEGGPTRPLGATGKGFADLVDAILDHRAQDMIIPGLDQPLVTDTGFAKADAHTILHTLFQIHGPPAAGSDPLEWYALDLPAHPGLTGRIDLPPALLSPLQEEVIAADLLGYSVNRHIFLFARRHGYLPQLFASPDGLVHVYWKFLTSPAYQRLSRNGLIPAPVLAALGAPVAVNTVRMNRFWRDNLQDIVGQTPLERFSTDQLHAMVADRFAHALLNDLFEPLIPMEWFSLYRKTRKPPDQTRATAPPRPCIARAKVLLRDCPMDRLRSIGWSGAGHPATPGLAKPAEPHGMTVIGHAGGSGLAKTVPMFRDALSAIGCDHRFLKAAGLVETGAPPRAPVRPMARRVNLFAVNADTFTPAAIQLAAREGEAADTLRIGSFFWETSRAPARHRLAAPFLDEVWTSTEFLRQVYLDLYDGKVPVRTMGMSVTVPPVIPAYPFWSLGLSGAEFVFLNVSDFDSSIVRKNPLPVVQAFRKAFPTDRDVRLILKIRRVDPQHWSNTNNYWSRVVDAIGNDPRITLLTGDLAEEDYWSLLASAGCYVTLHRGEGFGYGAAHAMLLGVPVIATDFSGTQDFCTKSTALLVPARQIPVAIGDMPFREDLGLWADPDVEVAATQMQHARQNGPPIRAMADRARHHVSTLYAPQGLQSRIATRLQDLGVWPGIR